MISLIIQRNNLIIANNAEVADSWLKRLIGLLSYTKLNAGEALWLCPCKSIHTIGMRFSIDVLFLDNTMKVVKLVHTVKPYRACRAEKSAISVLELPAGTLHGLDVKIGDRLVAISGRVTDEIQP